ncbi:MAG: nuclear transport factor 2 family protein [Azospirillaceae bacterium]|nr:nuclear transport factor 2 family protein [Azospirillaceae bacterium]
MTDSDGALAANRTFYRAFSERDVALMDALWAVQAPVLCIHPGWPPLIGRAAVLHSWHGILNNAMAPKIVFHEGRPLVHAGLILVVGNEIIGDALLVATNGFVVEDRQWRLVFHQAGHQVTEIEDPTALPRGPLH